MLSYGIRSFTSPLIISITYIADSGISHRLNTGTGLSTFLHKKVTGGFQITEITHLFDIIIRHSHLVSGQGQINTADFIDNINHSVGITGPGSIAAVHPNQKYIIDIPIICVR